MRMCNSSTRTCALSLTAALALVAQASLAIEAPEPVALVPAANGIATARGELEPGDVDVYTVSATAGELLFAALFDTQDGAFLDTRLAVLQGGVLLEDDDGGDGFLSRVALVAVDGGSYEVRVTGFRDAAGDGSHPEGADAPAPYLLVVAVVAPPLAAESESNDGVGDEDPVVAGGGVTRAKLGSLDVDRFAFDAASGDTLTVSLFPLDLATGLPLPPGDSFHDTRLGLFAPGALAADPPLDEDDDGGPGLVSNASLAVAAAGRYGIAVTGFRDTGYTGAHPEGPFDYALVAAAVPGDTAVERCDVVAPVGQIDVADVNAILAARGTAASGPDDPRDADGDGVITVLDGSRCRLDCTFPHCTTAAPVAPVGACGLTGIEPIALLVGMVALRRHGRNARESVEAAR